MKAVRETTEENIAKILSSVFSGGRIPQEADIRQKEEKCLRLTVLK
jgi:hypothetical protein